MLNVEVEVDDDITTDRPNMQFRFSGGVGMDRRSLRPRESARCGT